MTVKLRLVDKGGADTRPHRLFISGHSLTDRPFPDFLARIAESLGRSMHWNAQNLPGSTLRDRTRGIGSWAAIGNNRPNGGPALDLFIVTEQHTLLGNIVWNDTVRHLRIMHDEMIARSPACQTFLFTSWMDLSDRADPSRWIAYERAAAPVWACVAERLNLSLTAEGRADRVGVIPAALALAELVEHGRACAGPCLNALAQVEALFSDSVHLTEVGAYYVALICYAYCNGRSPLGAWAPAAIDAANAIGLQDFAWRFVSAQWARPQAEAADQLCRYTARTFVPLYLSYQRDTRWKAGGTLKAHFKWLRHRLSWPLLLRRKSLSNPLHFDKDRDREYWLFGPTADADAPDPQVKISRATSAYSAE